MKKIIILENNKGRLANQLWQYSNIYAYALEKNLILKNYAFFQYKKYFQNNNDLSVKIKSSPQSKKIIKLKKNIYSILPKIIKIIFKNQVVFSNKQFYLPPSKNYNILQQSILQNIENSKNPHFFCDWRFNNPTGLIKYHSKIVKKFTPMPIINKEIQGFISQLRKQYKILIGVHIRQEDYVTWNNGIYFFTCQEVRKILNSFLAKQLNQNDIMFVICSDGKIEDSAFKGLNYTKGLNEEILDLYTLAKTDLIIGSISTYGQWASYYGLINHINFSKEKINWHDCYKYQPQNNPWLNTNI